jgi:hypothetical protein
MTNVVAVNWGTKYGVEYTLRLYNMVKRNTTKDFKFYVLTDNTNYYDKYPYIHSVEIDTDLIGWWNKLLLFKKGTLPEGEYLYFDLDVVIFDNIDCFFDHNSFGITRDFIRPNDGLLPGPEYNSSILKFDNRTTNGIWQHYINNKKLWHNYQKQIHFFGDQNLISHYVNSYPDYLNVFPDEWIWSFKKGVERGKHAGDRSKWFGAIPPEGGKVCVFHGEPSPDKVDLEWVIQNWK